MQISHPFYRWDHWDSKHEDTFRKCEKLLSGIIKCFNPGWSNSVCFLINATWLKNKRQRKDQEFSTLWHSEIGHQNTSSLSPVLLPVFLLLARWWGDLFLFLKDYSHVHSHLISGLRNVGRKSSTPVPPFPRPPFLFTSASEAVILC